MKKCDHSSSWTITQFVSGSQKSWKQDKGGDIHEDTNDAFPYKHVFECQECGYTRAFGGSVSMLPDWMRSKMESSKR